MGNLKTKQTIEERVKILIADKLGVQLDEVVNDAEIKDDLCADSLDEVELIMELEKEFDIEIPDQEAGEFEKVSDYVSSVERHVANRSEVDLSNENTEGRV
jgi:acyl carrier protein